jgi:hypothetical protein
MSSEKGLSDLSKLKLKTAAYCQTFYRKRQNTTHPVSAPPCSRPFNCADEKRNI